MQGPVLDAVTWTFQRCQLSAAAEPLLPYGWQEVMEATICDRLIPRLPLPLPLGQCSCHRYSSSIHALQEVLDAVICDPPYGVRAGGRKVAPRPDICVPEGKAHFPVTEPYLMGECLRDLLDSAARLLRLGGRLSFFIPASEETYDVSGSRVVAGCANCTGRCAA